MDTKSSEPGIPGSERAADAERDLHAEGMGVRFKAARGDLSQKQLAERVGVHFNTISKLERGMAPVDTKLLMAIARATNTSAAWLLLGDVYPRGGYSAPVNEVANPGPRPAEALPATPAATFVPRSLEAVELGAYLYVPHFDVQASAGPGFFNEVENVVTMRPFELSYVRGKLGIHHNEVALLNIVGRSYEPLLHSGDVTMLDRRDREALEGPHVIRLDGALLVKQLQRMPGRVLRVSSKNTDYESFDIVPNEDAQRDFEVLGRLRWAGITMI